MDKRWLGVGCVVVGCAGLIVVVLLVAIVAPALVRQGEDSETASEIAPVVAESAVSASDSGMEGSGGQGPGGASTISPPTPSGDSESLTEGDHLGLELAREGQTLYVSQSSWGFELILEDPDFAPATELERQLNANQASQNAELGTDNARWWALATPDQARHVQIHAVKGMPADEADFRDYATGLEEGLSAVPNVSDIRRKVSWVGGSGRIEYRYRIDGIDVDFRCKNGQRPSGMPSIVCIQMIGLEGTRAERVFSNLEP